MAQEQSSSLQSRLLAAVRIHFFLVFIFGLLIIVTNAWRLITPQSVQQRWVMETVLLAATLCVWLAARGYGHTNRTHSLLVFCLVLADIGLATFLVYSERGMASRGVALYAIPIATSAIIKSRKSILAAAALCAAAYCSAAIVYFSVNFNEGYKIELYSVIAFYSALFFVLARLLMITFGESSS